jgi:hypothetical protein
MFDTFPEAAWTVDNHHVAGDTGLSEWRFIVPCQKFHGFMQ